ncbi:MAG: DUF167 domain-containing protein [Rhodospirillales bacterium]
MRILLTPKAAHARIGGLTADAAGAAAIKMAVTAVPENGKANAAMVKALAKTWRVPKTSLAVIAGAKDRRKTVLVAGDGKALAAQLTAWLAGPGRGDGYDG